MFTLSYQTLANRKNQQGDALPADIIAEVLAGDADHSRTGRSQDIGFQVVPLLNGFKKFSMDQRMESTPALVSYYLEVVTAQRATNVSMQGIITWVIWNDVCSNFDNDYIISS